MKEYKWMGLGVLIGILLWMVIGSNNIKSFNVLSLFNWQEEANKSDLVLTIGTANDAIGLDPAVVTDQESIKVAVNIYDTLLKYGRSGEGFLPSLAESWTMSEDGRVWQFVIRKDVTFHDGTHLDAEAVAFNFTRWMDASSPYHAGHFSYWNFNFGGFPGLVESVSALSTYVVEIRLTEPYAPFLSTLAMPAFSIASPDAIMTYNEGLKYKPVGTGPFVFESWSEDGVIILNKNTNYWGEKARLERVIFKSIPDANERLMKLKAGEIQLADPIPESAITQILEDQNVGLMRRPFFNIGYLAFNMKRPHLQLKAVRQAIAHAIDKEAMIKAAFDTSTRPADTFLPPVLWGHNESIKALAYDPEKSKSLLKSVGIEGEITLRLLVMDAPRAYFPEPVLMAQFIKKSLAQVGILVDLDIRSWTDVISMSKNGEYDMVVAGWTGDVADPDNFLYNFFSSDNMEKGLSTNYSLYQNSRVDTLLDQARQNADQAYRTSLYREVQSLIHQDMPAMPLVHTMPAIGVHSCVIGYTPHMIGEEPLNTVEMRGLGK